jgi:hypothetical protein
MVGLADSHGQFSGPAGWLTGPTTCPGRLASMVFAWMPGLPGLAGVALTGFLAWDYLT